jgi:hypothetical protein
MIVGRNARIPVIGDTVLSRSARPNGSGIIVAQTRLPTGSAGATAEPPSSGACAAKQIAVPPTDYGR